MSAHDETTFWAIVCVSYNVRELERLCVLSALVLDLPEGDSA